MGYSGLNGHLALINVKENSYCTCNNVIESPRHYFLECPLYAGSRAKLIRSLHWITNCNININVFLFGDKKLSYNDNIKIFHSVHEYINETKRF